MAAVKLISISGEMPSVKRIQGVKERRWRKKKINKKK
jgi:hypothetical protein